MKKLSSHKTAEGTQEHREGAKNGIRELKNPWIYPESGSDAKIKKSREGAAWINKTIVVKFIQIRKSKPTKPAARIITLNSRTKSHQKTVETREKPQKNYWQRKAVIVPDFRIQLSKMV